MGGLRYFGGMVQAKLSDQSGTFEVVPGVVIHSSARVQLVDYRDYDVDARVQVNDLGQAEVASLTVSQREGGPAVSGTSLRSIAVQSVLRQFAKMELQLSLQIEAGQDVSALGLIPTRDVERLRGQGPVPETLEAVAKVYRLAEFVGDAPTKSIEEAFGISRSTAGAWIGRARSGALIPPVPQPESGVSDGKA
jgi:hypothetical protein